VVAATTVLCPKCGLARDVGTRQLRPVERGEASGTCKGCQHALARKPPDDADRECWLRRFSDEEIVELTQAPCGRGSVEAVRSWRARLLATAPRPSSMTLRFRSVTRSSVVLAVADAEPDRDVDGEAEDRDQEQGCDRHPGPPVTHVVPVHEGIVPRSTREAIGGDTAENPYLPLSVPVER